MRETEKEEWEREGRREWKERRVSGREKAGERRGRDIEIPATHNIQDDSVKEVASLLSVHRVRKEVKEGRVITHSGRPFVLGAPSQLHVLVEGI